MNNDFIKMIDDIDFLYGFIYECANLINNLYDYNNYDHLVIKLYSEFVLPMINITKKEHEKEYNEHIEYIINNLEHDTNIFDICSYLMNICCERYFELSQDEYLEIKNFVDNNIDIIEYAFAPMIDYFDLCKKFYSHYYCQCCYYHREKNLHIFPGNIHREFHEKIIKSYFNIEYIKFFYLLQQSLVLQNVVKINKNICNINALMNLYYNSNIDCNKKNKDKLYDLYNTIALNKFVHCDIKK